MRSKGYRLRIAYSKRTQKRSTKKRAVCAAFIPWKRNAHRIQQARDTPFKGREEASQSVENLFPSIPSQCAFFYCAREEPLTRKGHHHSFVLCVPSFIRSKSFWFFLKRGVIFCLKTREEALQSMRVSFRFFSEYPMRVSFPKEKSCAYCSFFFAPFLASRRDTPLQGKRAQDTKSKLLLRDTPFASFFCSNKN